MAENLEVPYFDGSNMHVQDWLHCYNEVLDAKGIYECVPRLNVAGSRLLGEASDFWVRLSAIRRTNEGVYDSSCFCAELLHRFDLGMNENARKMKALRLKEFSQKAEMPYFDGSNMHVQEWLFYYGELKGIHEEVPKLLLARSRLVGEAREFWVQLDAIKRTNEGDYDSNVFCYDMCERFDPDLIENAREMEEQGQQRQWYWKESLDSWVEQNRRKLEAKNKDQILVQTRKLLVNSPQDDRVAVNEVGGTKDAQRMLVERSNRVCEDLPGFTRSVYKKDHALITPESHVFSPLPEWSNTMGAYLITPAMGSHFVMYLAKMQEHSRSGLPPDEVERLIFVVEGSVVLSDASGIRHKLTVDSYAYLPPEYEHSIKCDTSATLVVFERRYASLENHIPEFIVGSTDKQPLLETPGEIFELRKLLPTSLPYDFNIHIMDFQPGEFLNVKEVHYNQHGLLLLEGQGIYRLGDSWYPVQAGDVIWMAPFVPQWYAALGKTGSRYLLYKDVNRNPL